MNDGHSGFRSETTAQWEAGIFRAVLSSLKDTTGGASLILHVSSTTSYASGLQPNVFLRSLDLRPFHIDCQHVQGQCYWREVARVQREAVFGLAFREEMQRTHHALNQFLKQIPTLYELRKRGHEILAELGWEQGWPEIFNAPVPIIKAEPTAVPTWINAIEFKPLRDLKETRRGIDSQIVELSRCSPLVYETDVALENAVVEALRCLGLKARRTEQGFTIDVLAETGDGAQKFGIEVTGVTGPIKKDSRKLTQLNQFLLERENDEKAILVANTFRDRPPAERSGEDFTSQVLNHFDGRGVLLMTGWDLYRLVGDVVEERSTKEDAVARLRDTSGRWRDRP